MVTFTLCPTLYKHKASKQLKKSIWYIQELLKEYAAEYIMTAELTQKLNIHYHVIVLFNDKPYSKEMLMNEIKGFPYNKIIGNTFVNSKCIDGELERNRSFEYITKEQDKTDRIVNGKNKKKLPIWWSVRVPPPALEEYNLNYLDAVKKE